MSSCVIKWKASVIQVVRHKTRNARRAMRRRYIAFRRLRDYFASCISSGPGTPFDSVSWGRRLRRLARCSRTPVAARSHLYPAGSSVYSNRPAWAADGIVIWQTQGPASEGLPVKPRLHIRTNPRQTQRGFPVLSSPPNYLIGVTRAVNRATSFLSFLSSFSRYQCLDRRPSTFLERLCDGWTMSVNSYTTWD